MNIFILDTDPVKAAQYHCDKHVVKMVLETAQLLSTAVQVISHREINGLYRQTHLNHPCSIWARESLENFLWLTSLGNALGDEYTHRYKRQHKSAAVIQLASYHAFDFWDKFPIRKGLEFVQCMPMDLRHKDPVTAYRNYYISDKLPFAKWTNRDMPPWWPTALVAKLI